jgi:phage terminase large subunit-like protein
MAALVGLEMFLDDGEHGAEVYSGAGSEKQAHEVFGPAKLMLDRSPKIRDAAGVEVWAKALVKPEDNSRFWPVIGKPGDGASPSCAIIDEYHEHQTSDLVDTMISGMGAREQPLLVIITTAGTDLASPCHDKHREVQKLLEGTVENDECFAIIYGIDEGDDWASPKAIRKANPNLGVSVDEEFLLAQQRQAVLNPAYQNRFRTKHLDEWCGASVAGINMQHWKLAADPSLSLEQFAGEECVLALDLASKIDICARMLLFKRTESGGDHYFAFGRFWLPEDTIDEARSNQQAYRKWVAQGHLVATEGAEIDFEVVREDAKACRSRFQIREVVYDPWRATQLAHQLAKDGAAVVEMPQTAKNMGAAFDELLSALKGGRFHHDGNPVLEWMASNVIARTAMKGVTVPGKDKPEQKIDGVVAACMCLSRAMAGEPESEVQAFFV